MSILLWSDFVKFPEILLPVFHWWGGLKCIFLDVDKGRSSGWWFITFPLTQDSLLAEDTFPIQATLLDRSNYLLVLWLCPEKSRNRAHNQIPDFFFFTVLPPLSEKLGSHSLTLFRCLTHVYYTPGYTENR